MQCNKGYELRGSVARKCDKVPGTDQLHWTGNTTYCEGEECDDFTMYCRRINETTV